MPRSSSAVSRATASPRAAGRTPAEASSSSSACTAASSIWHSAATCCTGPVVELLRDPPALGPLREQALGAEVSSLDGSVDHRLAERDGDRLGAGLRLELREDVAHVTLHGLL